MFIVNYNYIKPIEEVNNFTEAHRAYLSEHYKTGKFILGGPKVPRDGGVVIANARSKQEVEVILSKDPFIIEGIAACTLIEFNPLLSASDLERYKVEV
ncbi:MAG: YciI family protein [Reichenbachiella sp.]|uniref:YciI family protein n=1 Tax=Reichenbachiella sp. TaxID=2184521 RepID=UPI003264F0BC